MSENTSRYPVEKNVYYRSVGKLLPHRVGQRIEQSGYCKKNGYTIWINQDQSNGVDLKVWYSENLVLVGEILNWSVKSWLSEKRKEGIIDNLKAHSCKRVLIYTALANEAELRDLESHGISVLRIGYQLLPKCFYNFFAKAEKIESRKVDSSETSQDIKSKLTDFLRSSNIETQISSSQSDHQSHPEQDHTGCVGGEKV